MTKKNLSPIAASIVVASGIFVGKMLLSPPETQAAPQGIDTHQMTLSASKNLPSFDDTHQRYLGVLDVLAKQ